MSGREDWTTGAARLQISRCESCGASWYLPRQRCASCRGSRIVEVDVDGGGTAVAVTHGGIVGRADEGTPSGLALVDLDEGVRVMTTCDARVEPGARVSIAFTDPADGGTPLPIALLEGDA
ncbi:MAG: Zn-ribbon domain-containing OB-fold protein [Candidatus Nanopelagicales bacterium]